MRIFINYRRDDSAGYVLALRPELEAAKVAGVPCQTFIDVKSIRPGSAFVQDIVAALGTCDVVLAIIGHQWLVTNGQRRLHEPEDHVRRELRTAIDGRVTLIVVLLSGATLPSAAELPADIRALTTAPRVQLRDDTFPSDVKTLVATLSSLEVPSRGEPAPAILRFVPDGMGYWSASDRRFVRVNRRKIGMLLTGGAPIDFALPAGDSTVSLGRGFMWSDPLAVTLRSGKITTVSYQVTSLGKSRLWIADGG